MTNTSENDLPNNLENLPKNFQILSKKIDRLLEISEEPKPEPESDKWLNMQELREYHPAKPTEGTVRTWIRERKVTYYKGTKENCFLKSEIDAWIREGRVKSRSEMDREASDYVKNSRKK